MKSTGTIANLLKKNRGRKVTYYEKRDPINPRDMPANAKDKRGKLKSQKRTKATEELPKATKFKTDRQSTDEKEIKEENLPKDSFKDSFNRESSREDIEEKRFQTLSISKKRPRKKKDRG